MHSHQPAIQEESSAGTHTYIHGGLWTGELHALPCQDNSIIIIIIVRPATQASAELWTDTEQDEEVDNDMGT